MCVIKAEIPLLVLLRGQFERYDKIASLVDLPPPPSLSLSLSLSLSVHVCVS